MWNTNLQSARFRFKGKELNNTMKPLTSSEQQGSGHPPQSLQFTHWKPCQGTPVSSSSPAKHRSCLLNDKFVYKRKWLFPSCSTLSVTIFNWLKLRRRTEEKQCYEYKIKCHKEHTLHASDIARKIKMLEFPFLFLFRSLFLKILVNNFNVNASSCTLNEAS